MNLMQREVEIVVEEMDKGGAALGAMFAASDLEKGDSDRNVGVFLLKKGLARVVPFSAERSKY